jgi:hypothetical protein
MHWTSYSCYHIFLLFKWEEGVQLFGVILGKYKIVIVLGHLNSTGMVSGRPGKIQNGILCHPASFKALIIEL